MRGVGNDVVDLKEPDNRGKSGDERFLARVFTAQERELIAQAAAPDTLLWSFWAAKEAAYKAVSGGDPRLDYVSRFPAATPSKSRPLRTQIRERAESPRQWKATGTAVQRRERIVSLPGG